MPRTYEVTLDDGRAFEVDWDGDGEPTEVDLSSALGLSAGEPHETGPGLFGRTMNVLGRVGQTLSRPESLVMNTGNELLKGAMRRQDVPTTIGNIFSGAKDVLTPTGIGTFEKSVGFGDVLGTAGMEEGWTRAGLGLAGDIVADPLNLLAGPTGLSAKIGSAFSKASKKSDALMGARRLTQVHPGLETTQIPELGITMRDYMRLHDSRLRGVTEQADKLVEDMFKGVDPDQASLMLRELDETGHSTTLPALGERWKQEMERAHTKYRSFAGIEDEGTIIPRFKQDQMEREAIAGNVYRGFVRSGQKTDVPFAEDVARGASENAPEILGKHLAATDRAEVNNEFFMAMKQHLGSEEPREGFRKLWSSAIDMPATMNDLVKNTYFPEDVAKTIEKAGILWERPNEMDNMFKSATKLWKAGVTAVNPRHHFNNFLGNIHNMYVGSDMSMRQVLNGIADATRKLKTDDPAEAIGQIGNYSGREIWKAIQDYEVTGTSNQLGELAEAGTASWLANNPIIRGARKWGTENVEDPAKAAFFLHHLKQGKTLEQAALEVKNVLMDYNELTSAERGLRDYMVPFYTWMRKNIPLQLKSMVDRPYKYEKMTDVLEAPWNAMESQVNDTVIPEQRQDAGYVPSPMTTPTGELVLQRLAFPSSDVNRVNDPGLLTDLLGPAPKFALEAALGKRTMGPPIQSASGMSRPSTMANVLAPLNYLLPDSMEGYITPRNVGGRPMQHDVMSWMMGFTPAGPLDTTVMGTDPMQPQLSWLPSLLGKLTGATPDPVTVGDQRWEAMQRVQEWRRQMMQQRIMEEPY